MQKTDIRKILRQIAKEHNTTVSNIHKEIENAMRIAQSAPILLSRLAGMPFLIRGQN